jgi:hypothetical protein
MDNSNQFPRYFHLQNMRTMSRMWISKEELISF